MKTEEKRGDTEKTYLKKLCAEQVIETKDATPKPKPAAKHEEISRDTPRAAEKNRDASKIPLRKETSKKDISYSGRNAMPSATPVRSVPSSSSGLPGKATAKANLFNKTNETPRHKPSAPSNAVKGQPNFTKNSSHGSPKDAFSTPMPAFGSPLLNNQPLVMKNLSDLRSNQSNNLSFGSNKSNSSVGNVSSSSSTCSSEVSSILANERRSAYNQRKSILDVNKDSKTIYRNKKGSSVQNRLNNLKYGLVASTVKGNGDGESMLTSAPNVRNKAVEKLPENSMGKFGKFNETNKSDSFVLMNSKRPDMLGHTVQGGWNAMPVESSGAVKSAQSTPISNRLNVSGAKAGYVRKSQLISTASKKIAGGDRCMGEVSKINPGKVVNVMSHPFRPPLSVQRDQSNIKGKFC